MILPRSPKNGRFQKEELPTCIQNMNGFKIHLNF